MSARDEKPPQWFSNAIAAPRESRVVAVDGCDIHYLRWGDAARPGLVFVPPGGGHAHWFAHVAPLFADQFNVVAMDPSGCGDSGRRESYSQAAIDAEILAVCADAGMFSIAARPTLVGHSAGAQLAVRTAQAHGERLLGVVTLDGLRYAELEKDHAVKILKDRKPVASPRPPRVYPELDEALARFRLSPAPLRPTENSFIVDMIAANSFRQVEGGWSSKHDPAQIAVIDLAMELKDALGRLPCHGAAVYAEHTHLAEADVADRMAELNGPRVPVFIVPDTSHYLQIDQPFAFVTAIKGVVLGWLGEELARF